MANNSSILKTLIYSDIFDYPLTKEELWRFLIAKNVENIDRVTFKKALIMFPPGRWEYKHGFYFLSGREEIVGKRERRKKEGGKKLDFARKIIQKLSLVPTVSFIGISGGLALENSEKNDDIDLFVITSKNTLWVTRLILVFLLIIMGQYRGRGKKESQKVCLNMLIDEESLSFPKKRQDLYTAHEIVQLRPVLNRNNVYEKFMNANRWVKKFLPNGIDIRILGYKDIKKKSPSILISQYLSIFERIAKSIQLSYMKKHRTKETISDHFLAFHPFDYKSFVLKEYNKRLNKYDPPSPRLRRVMPRTFVGRSRLRSAKAEAFTKVEVSFEKAKIIQKYEQF